ncbi:MAG: glutathione binding-like protein, partial [Salaquimonas sp.]
SQLGKNDWLAGSFLSVADIVFGTLLYRYYTLEITRPDLPNLANYYEKLKLRSAYEHHAMIDYNFMRVE